jgi:nitric oxide dioxygenase
MTEDDIRIVQKSFELLKERSDQFGAVFYERLFTTYPPVRTLFARDIAPQSKKLVQMLAMVVASLDKLDAIMPAVAELARRHRTYGVTEAHYPIVGATLLWTLAQGLGESYTKQVEEAWTAAFAILSGAMIAASADT